MKRFLVILLVVLVLVVWAINGRLLRAIIAAPRPAPQHAASARIDSVRLDMANFVYKPLGYDPFYSLQPADTLSRQRTIPKLKLRGIVMTRKGNLALLETEANEIFDLKEGEEVKGLKLEKITATSVVLAYRKQRVELKVLE